MGPGPGRSRGCRGRLSKSLGAMGLRPIGINPIATVGWVPGTAVRRYIACETLDMLKSGIRSAGMAVREK
jgi:hypothetical protein